jgi:hypothetical protein
MITLKNRIQLEKDSLLKADWENPIIKLDDMHHQREHLPEDQKGSMDSDIENTKAAVHEHFSKLTQGKPHEMHAKHAANPSGWHPDTVAHFKQNAG